ncbi:hepatocyte growth factor receptor-like [Physella acuta]|uniref:hepatocyte growth factor receptor-like n=1 Tax=Physella acuta TaxID=109671 RepID=UPI0027DB4FC4|nr:hepatocyte growth factor receptor-like [Physella acuta]
MKSFSFCLLVYLTLTTQIAADKNKAKQKRRPAPKVTYATIPKRHTTQRSYQELTKSTTVTYAIFSHTLQTPLFVSPNKTLISGGTWINVTGPFVTNRNAVYLDVSSVPTTKTLECNSPADTTEILCRSPNLAGSITQNLFTPKGFVTYPLVIQPDGQENYTVTFEIHPNPSFHQLMDHGINVLLLNDMFVTFILRGNRIPTWMKMEDIKIEVEDLNCEVLETSTRELICSSQEVNLHNQKYNPNTEHGRQSPKLVTEAQLNSVADGTTQAPTKALKKLSANLSKFLNNETSNETLYVNVSITLGNFQVNHTVTLHWHQVNVSDPMMAIFAAVGGCSSAVLLAVCLLVILRVSKSKAKKVVYGLNIARQGSGENVLPTLKQVLDTVIEPDKKDDMDKLIISLDRLTVGQAIGEGNFGRVYEGIFDDGNMTCGSKVALKTLQDPMSSSQDLKSFVQEALFMRKFKHPNVLGLIGLSEKEPGNLYVVLPFMDRGDLLTYIRDNSMVLTLHDVIKFGADIADGMNYLSSLKFVHRDLAARNCMLDSSNRVKVADFGLCRDIYEKGYYTSDNKKQLPIRWMAIESIEKGAYSTMSDVWSLGVVLWEMLTRGMTPYPGVDGWDIINFLRRRRLPAPFFCPDELYKLMMFCWAKDPRLRPTFKKIRQELLSFIGAESTTTNSVTDHAEGSSGSGDRTSALDNNISFLTFNLNNAPLQQSVSYVNEKSCENTETKLEDSAGIKVTGSEVESKVKVLANVYITMPLCASQKDVDQSMQVSFYQLVDNYEPPPSFTHSKQETGNAISKPDAADSQGCISTVNTPVVGAVPVDQPSYFILEPDAGEQLTDDESDMLNK